MYITGVTQVTNSKPKSFLKKANQIIFLPEAYNSERNNHWFLELTTCVTLRFIPVFTVI